MRFKPSRTVGCLLRGGGGAWDSDSAHILWVGFIVLVGDCRLAADQDKRLTLTEEGHFSTGRHLLSQPRAAQKL